jgi:hypothetical protein
VDAITKEFNATMAGDVKMKETFINKSEEEFNRLYQQYIDEDQKFENDLRQIKRTHREKICKIFKKY